MAAALHTAGHGAGAATGLGERLRAAGVELVVDIRIAPGSRRHPHFGREALAGWLPDYGASYRWEKRLGGFRRPPPDSPDVALRNDAFRGYAAWMRGPEFLAAVDEVLAEAVERRTTVLCSETLWWRCHRRLVADFARLARGVDVEHLLPGGPVPHRPTDGVRRRDDGLLVYDAVHGALTADPPPGPPAAPG